MADEIKIKELAAKLFAGIKNRVEADSTNFFTNHLDAKEFLEKQTKKMAGISLDMVTADDAGRARLAEQMERQEAIVDTELLSIANNAVPAAKDAFKNVLKTAWSIVKDILPIVLPSIL